MDPDLPRNTESLGFLALTVIDLIDMFLSMIKNEVVIFLLFILNFAIFYIRYILYRILT